MSCQFDNLPRLASDYGNPNAPVPLSAVPDPNSPALFVSNAPEQIGPGTGDFDAWEFGAGPYNLCKARVGGNNLPSKIRVFLWHVSRFSTPSFFWLIIGGAGTSTVTVSNIRAQVQTHLQPLTDLTIPGRCLAAAQLFGTLDNLGIPAITISGSGERVIWSAFVPQGSNTANEFQLIAAVIEFDVLAIGIPLSELTIRTAVSLTGESLADFGTYSTPLADNRNNFGDPSIHVRGYWRHADIKMLLPGELNATLGPTPPSFLEWQFCKSTGPEAKYFSSEFSLAEGAANSPGNPAGYGANLTYVATYHNNSPDTAGRVYAGIKARHVGQPFSGAGQVRTIVPTPTVVGKPVKIQPIPHPNTQPPPANTLIERLCDLTSVYPQGPETGYIVVGFSSSGTLQVRIANGGGAALPANIIVSRQSLDITVNGDPE
jgi:hypothetical protein